MINAVNIAYYEKKDWDYFLSIIDDRESMHNSWEEWYQSYLKTKAALISKGFFVKEIPINMHELIEFCAARKIPNNGKARSQFVMTK